MLPEHSEVDVQGHIIFALDAVEQKKHNACRDQESLSSSTARITTTEKHMVLSDLIPGNTCTIKNLRAKDRLGQRLLDLGIYPGAELKVLRNAPLEDPPWKWRLTGSCSACAMRRPATWRLNPSDDPRTSSGSGRTTQLRQIHGLQHADRGLPARGQLSRRHRGKKDRSSQSRPDIDRIGRSARNLKPDLLFPGRTGRP